MRYESEHSPRRGQADTSTYALARGLGWFSIGLGLIEVAAPGSLARALGMEDKEGLIQAYGVREIANGLAILASDDPAPWVWGRVLGDGLDIATLAIGLGGENPKSANVAVALAAVAGVTAVDIYCAQTLSCESKRRLLPMRDYSGRRGFPRAAEAMRGAARQDAFIPEDMRTPAALRPLDESDAVAEHFTQRYPSGNGRPTAH